MIKRKARHSHYTIVDNKLINDQNLEWEDAGVLIYLLSKPDYWEVSVSHLTRQRKAGKARIYAILKRLRDAGYAEYVRRPDGKTDWIISENPMVVENPHPENRDKEESRGVKTEKSKKAVDNQPAQAKKPKKPHPENPDQANRTQVNTDKAVSTEYRYINNNNNARKGVFTMPYNWEPSFDEYIAQMLTARGITQERVDDQLEVFRTHHHIQKTTRTAENWNKSFLHSLVAIARNPDTSKAGERHANNKPTFDPGSIDDWELPQPGEIC